LRRIICAKTKANEIAERIQDPFPAGKSKDTALRLFAPAHRQAHKKAHKQWGYGTRRRSPYQDSLLGVSGLL
jgi:hypothetical protein